MHSTGRMPDMMGVFWCLVGFLWLKADACDCVGCACKDKCNIDFLCVCTVPLKVTALESRTLKREEHFIINSMANKKVVDHGSWCSDGHLHSSLAFYDFFFFKASKLAWACVNVIGNLCVHYCSV